MTARSQFNRRTPKEQVCVCLTKAQIAQVKEVCQREGITYGELMMRGIKK